MSTHPRYSLALAIFAVAILLSSCRKHVIEDPNYQEPLIAYVSGTVSDASGPVTGADVHVIYAMDSIAAPAQVTRHGVRTGTHTSGDRHGDATMDCGFSIIYEFIPMNHAVRINWTVVYSLNLSYFEVRRDGVMIAWLDATNIPAGHMYSLTDTALTNGTTYYYSIMTQCIEGLRDSLPGLPMVPTDDGFDIPGYELYQNHPNPVEDNARIPFDLPATAWVTLTVYNSLRQPIATLADSTYLSWWSYEAEFDGDTLCNGFYDYYIVVGDAYTSHRTLLKNTTNYAQLRVTAPAATSGTNGSFVLSIAVGDTVQLYDDDGFWTGAAVLSRATIVALKSGYAAADTLLELPAGSSQTANFFLTPGH